MEYPVNYKRDLGDGRWVAIKERHGKYCDLIFSNGRKILYTTDDCFISKNYDYKYNMHVNDRTGSERVQPDGTKLIIIDYRNSGDLDCAKIGIGAPEIICHKSYQDYQNDLADINERPLRRKRYAESKRGERDGTNKDLGDGYKAVCHYRTCHSCTVDIVDTKNHNEKVVEGLSMTYDRFQTGRYARQVLDEALGKPSATKNGIKNIEPHMGKTVTHKVYGNVIPIKNNGKTVRVVVQGKGIADVKLKDLRL